MAREQQYQAEQRQVVNDPAAQARRLSVEASPLNIPVASKVHGISQLAAALGVIKPALMDYAIDKQSDAIAQEITVGKNKALAGLSPEEVTQEHQKWGYDSYNGFLQGESLGDKLENDWKAQDKDGLVFDDWYKEWWKQNADPALNSKSEYFSGKYQQAFTKQLVAVRSADAATQQTILNQKHEDTVIGVVHGALLDAKANGQSFGVPELEALTKDLQVNSPTVSRGRVDELAYQAARTYAEESGDISPLKAFTEKHTDGTPGLADKKLTEHTRFSDQIQMDIRRIQNQNYERVIQSGKLGAIEKENKRNAIWMEALKSDMTDEGIQQLKSEMIKSNLYSSPMEVDAELSHVLNINKKSETKSQTINALELERHTYEGQPINEKDVIQAYRNEEISKEGAQRVMGVIQQAKRQAQTEARADERAAKTASSVYKDVNYGRGKDLITAMFSAKNAGLQRDDTEAAERIGLARADALKRFSFKAMTAQSSGDILKFASEIADEYKNTLEEGGSPLPANLSKYTTTGK